MGVEMKAVKNNASMNMGGDNPFDMFSNILGEGWFFFYETAEN